ncbi:hypothetical protein G6F57_021631 [Rhizopus arrhizus]|nr:hypothetical protein G6F57_021631 [Rhizopus arrhizus]
MHRVFLRAEGGVGHALGLALVVVEIAVADVAEADDADAGHQRLKPCAGAAALPARARATPRGRAPGGQTQRSPRR